MAINNKSINPIGHTDAWANTPCPLWLAHTTHRDPTAASTIELQSYENHTIQTKIHFTNNSFDSAKENRYIKREMHSHVEFEWTLRLRFIIFVLPLWSRFMFFQMFSILKQVSIYYVV